MTPTRRAVLTGATALIPAAVLIGCGAVTTTTTNGVTTITINVAQINAWATAFINAAALVAALPGIAGTPTGLAITGVGGAAKLDLGAFTAVAGNSLSLTFNSTSAPAAVQSLLADGNELLTDAKGALGSVASTALGSAQTYVTALGTIVSLFQAAMGVSASVATVSATAPMSESTALKTLGVH